MALMMGLVLLPAAGPACGPDFPNSMLEDKRSVVESPQASFKLELKRLALPPSEFTNVQKDTTTGDLDDLREALQKSGALEVEVEETVAAQKAQHEKLGEYLEGMIDWQREKRSQDDDARHRPPPTVEGYGANVIEGLPGEFADYFRGAIAWRAGRTNEAREAWSSLLARPIAERHYRSTWAAYMLGRSWENEDPNRAATYFQQTRGLETSGFADRLGLAASSLGFEARLLLRQKQYERAMQMYLEQLATGDESVDESLRYTANQSLGAGPEVLKSLAANPTTRRVMMAYVISCSYDQDNEARARAELWENAVEAADVHDLESAEQMALAAYELGKWELAQRWLDLAAKTPTADWLQAKLFLMGGKMDEAAPLLSELCRRFPIDQPSSNIVSRPDLLDSLSMRGFVYSTNMSDKRWESERVEARRQMLGELGTVRLSRREYIEALDALVRSGFWLDAAYVAERVLTVEELKTYVDRNWPAPEEPQTHRKSLWDGTDNRREIRHLLARRLAWSDHRELAGPYFPADLQTNFDAFQRNLAVGIDDRFGKLERGRALFEAAKIARTNGMDLFGTELGPDWAVEDEGNFEGVLTIEWRASLDTNSTPTPPSEDELARGKSNSVIPEKRFHYRYQAASLAWEAAKLMPDNSDETALMLCKAGSWLKNRDPETADLFYKALVRRCRKTALGDQADKMRWFPELDANDQIVPWKPEPLAEPPELRAAAEQRAFIDGGFYYVLRRGNSLQDVADAVWEAHGLVVTVKDLQTANPAVLPGKLVPGQKIFVPLPRFGDIQAP